MLIKALVENIGTNIRDSKGGPISGIRKGQTVDVSDEDGELLLGHIHPEMGPLWRRASPSTGEMIGAAVAQAVGKPPVIRRENAAR